MIFEDVFAYGLRGKAYVNGRLAETVLCPPPLISGKKIKKARQALPLQIRPAPLQVPAHRCRFRHAHPLSYSRQPLWRRCRTSAQARCARKPCRSPPSASPCRDGSFTNHGSGVGAAPCLPIPRRRRLLLLRLYGRPWRRVGENVNMCKTVTRV